MGCGASSGKAAEVSNNPTSRQVKVSSSSTKSQNQNKSENSIFDIPKNDQESNKAIYNYIIDGVDSFKVPSGLIPIVCLSENTFPICVNNLRLGEDKITNIQLPIIAASNAGNGKIICFSSYKMFSEHYTDKSQFVTLVSNACKWLCGHDFFLLAVLFLELPPKVSQYLHNILLPMGLKPEVGNLQTKLTNFPIIFISSHIQFNSPEELQKLVNYIDNGGSVFCVGGIESNEAIHEEPVNPFIRKFGLAYTMCAISPEKAPSEIITLPQYDYIGNVRLPDILEYLRDRRENEINPDVHDSALLERVDDLVTAVRYYVIVSGEMQFNILVEMYTSALNYLKKIGYRNDNLLCPETMHNVIAILLEDILAKLPISSITVHPDADIFPGIMDDLDFGEYEIQITLLKERLISTGFWVAPGKIAYIECDGKYSNVSLQIGIHNSPILTKPGPYKRWPTVITTFEISQGKIEVATPFGGMLFVAVTELPDELEGTRMKMICKNVAMYPMYSLVEKDIYENTKNSKVKWGEISCQTAIITLKTEDLQKIPDIEKSATFIDKLIRNISDFLSYEIQRPYRIVFDYDHANEEFEEWYPITVLTGDFDGIFIDINHPNYSLFHLLEKISRVSLCSSVFDSDVETALSNLSAMHTFREIYPDFDPHNFNFFKPPLLFEELWEIYTKIDIDIIKNVVKVSQDSNFDENAVDEDKWITFLHNLCKVSNMNLTSLFQNAKSIPLNLISDLIDLPSPVYKNE